MNMRSRGFSLIEIMISVGIMGMLASVVMGSFNVARVKARDAKRVAEMRSLETALQLYFEVNKEYPDSIAGLANSLVNPPGNQKSYISEPKEGDNSAEAMYIPYKVRSNLTGGNFCDEGDSCQYYHLGMNLEQDASGNTILNLDADRVGSDIDGGDAWGCTFGAKEPKRYCYDLVPD